MRIQTVVLAFALTLAATSTMEAAKQKEKAADDIVVAEFTFPDGAKASVPKGQKIALVAHVTLKGDKTPFVLQSGDKKVVFKVTKDGVLQMIKKPGAESYGFGVFKNKEAIKLKASISGNDYEESAYALSYDGETLKIELKP